MQQAFHSRALSRCVDHGGGGSVGRAAETADDRLDRFAKDNDLSVLCGWPV